MHVGCFLLSFRNCLDQSINQPLNRLGAAPLRAKYPAQRRARRNIRFVSFRSVFLSCSCRVVSYRIVLVFRSLLSSVAPKRVPNCFGLGAYRRAKTRHVTSGLARISAYVMTVPRESDKSHNCLLTLVRSKYYIEMTYEKQEDRLLSCTSFRICMYICMYVVL